MRYTKIGWHAFQLVDDFVEKTLIKGFTVKTDWCTLSPDGALFLKKYYAWDGPTGAWPSKYFVKGSGVHDAFCELINLGLLPKSVQYLADEEMRQINDEGKMWKPRVMWTYLMVRLHMMRKRKWKPRKVYVI